MTIVHTLESSCGRFIGRIYSKQAYGNLYHYHGETFRKGSESFDVPLDLVKVNTSIESVEAQLQVLLEDRSSVELDEY